MKLFLKGMAIIMAVTLISCSNGGGKDKVIPKDVELEKLEDKSASKNEKQGNLFATDTATFQRNSQNIPLQSGSPATTIDWEKKIVKTANLSVELADYKTYNSAIHNNIKRYGAYIANEQQNQSDNKIENVMSIKVPVAQFEDLIIALPSEGVKVLEKRINTEDVTGEIVDTKARIEARKQVRDQYLGLLKKAKTIKEILEVQKEVNSIQEDIEAGTGRADLLGHEAAYSTVNLTYFQNLVVSPDNNNLLSAFFTKLKNAFFDGVSIVSGFLLMIVTLWPLIFAVVIIFVIFKKYGTNNIKPVKKEQ